MRQDTLAQRLEIAQYQQAQLQAARSQNLPPRCEYKVQQAIKLQKKREAMNSNIQPTKYPLQRDKQSKLQNNNRLTSKRIDLSITTLD